MADIFEHGNGGVKSGEGGGRNEVGYQRKG